MKKVLCLALVLVLLIPCAFAENVKQLPQPDEKGRTKYLGEVGWLFDENGDFIKESLFDQAVIWIEEIPGVYDACITVEKGKYYDTINITIVAYPTPSLADAKDIADSALRKIGLLFGMTDEYEGPTKDSFGTIFDDYMSLTGIFSISGKQICLGATSSNRARITW